MTDTERVSDVDFCSELTLLIVQESVMSFCHHKCVRYYRTKLVLLCGDCLSKLVTSYLKYFSSEKVT
jgi:hypothetical protein